MKKYLKSEFRELVEAMENDDKENICEEIGDLFFVLLMIAEIEGEAGNFTFTDTLEGINSKLIRRHPHVFGDAEISSEEELRTQWEKIKREEKLNK